MTTTEMKAALQRAADFGPQGNTDSAGQPAGWFKKARERHAHLTTDEHAARKFGRNPKGFVPSAV